MCLSEKMENNATGISITNDLNEGRFSLDENLATVAFCIRFAVGFI